MRFGPPDRRLVVVTGKGGVGKTTVAAALGLLGASMGRPTTVVELGEQSRLPALFEVDAADGGSLTQLGERLQALSIDPELALLEWLQALGGRVSGRVLAASSTFQYFAAAAPGAKELVSMVKLWRLSTPPRRARGAAPLVVLDAPATGHALGLLRSPWTFGAIARVGPIARQTTEIQQLLQDPERSAYVGVALGSDMAVTEMLELRDGLRESLGRDLSSVVVNALLPRRFSGEEMRRIAPLLNSSDPLASAAARAAGEAHGRAAFQHGQLARLRRRGLHVVPLPFHWDRQLDVATLGRFAELLRRHG